MKRLFSLLIALTPLASFAHPGHGHTEGFSIIHYFSEPVHLVGSLAILAIGYGVYWKFSTKKTDK